MKSSTGIQQDMRPPSLKPEVVISMSGIEGQGTLGSTQSADQLLRLPSRRALQLLEIYY